MNRQWTDEQLAVLVRMYPDHTCEAIAASVGRSRPSVYAKAKALGLKKSAAFYASERSGRGNLKTAGSQTRFQSGQVSWNKGQSFQAGGRSAETRFAKGSKPHNTTPIGHERICDGYLQRKVADTGCTRRDYRPVHHLVWIAAGNQIPPGHVLIFRDRNRQNITLENLELITRSENAQRNSIHRYPPEVRDLMRLQGRVTRQIRKNARASQP